MVPVVLLLLLLPALMLLLLLTTKSRVTSSWPHVATPHPHAWITTGKPATLGLHRRRLFWCPGTAALLLLLLLLVLTAFTLWCTA
jgi:hypothetical protein